MTASDLLGPNSSNGGTPNFPSLEDYDLFSSDTVLMEAVTREGGAHAVKELKALGLAAGSADAFAQGRDATMVPPRLRALDRFGQRLDVVSYHPAFHALVALSAREGLSSSLWTSGAAASPAKTGAHVKRAAQIYLSAQMDAGHLLPLIHTNAAAAVLFRDGGLPTPVLGKLMSRGYDPEPGPVEAKSSLVVGLAPFGRPGAPAVTARPIEADGAGVSAAAGTLLLNGSRWFVAAPMADAFLLSAATDEGPTCVFVPRRREDGSHNGIALRGLMDVSGLASAGLCELSFSDSHAVRIGRAGEALALLDEALAYVRLDVIMASLGLMRRALYVAAQCVEGIGIARGAGARALAVSQLATLEVEAEGALVLGFRLARASDRAFDRRAAAWRRVMTPVSLDHICRTAFSIVTRAAALLGEAGSLNDFPLAQIARDLPQLAALADGGLKLSEDLLSTLLREQAAFELVMDDLSQGCADDPALISALGSLEALLQEPRLLDVRAGELVERLGDLAAGVILKAHAPQIVATAFCQTHLARRPSHLTLQDAERLAQRASHSRQ